jgi:UDP-GlcNAc:undecaprenyl-phosphate/decaprenyl-phosphate GlcNAc-1-phosphate transferase
VVDGVESATLLQLSTLAAALSLLIIPLMWRLAPRLGLVDVPDARKVHKVPVARVGGWGITIGSLIPLLLWVKLDAPLVSFIAGILILFVFGIWDDLRDIGHWTKFFGQLLAAGVVVYYGDLYVARIPFLDDTLSAAVGKPLTMFALVGTINAINHSDGLDGLAAGESMLSLIGAAILGYLADSVAVISVALAMMGGVLGFLRYNSHPARVFMGDAGSQVLGFALGFLAVYLTQRADTALSAALPLLLLGVPVADILVVLWKRIWAHMNWFRASRNHAHHRLLDLGFAHYQTVIIIYSIHAALVFGAVVLRYESDLRVTLTYLVMITALLGGLVLAERQGWRVVGRHAGGKDGISSWWEQLKSTRLRVAARRLISVVAPAMMLLGSVWVARIPREIGLGAAVFAALLATELWLARARPLRTSVVRVTMYVAAIASAYLIVSYPGLPAQRLVETGALAAVAALVVAIGAYVRFAVEDKFDTTPTDFLIIFALIALIVLAAIDSSASSRALVEVIVYAVVLLYSCEVLIGRSVQRWNGFNMAALTALTVMAIRGLI